MLFANLATFKLVQALFLIGHPNQPQMLMAVRDLSAILVQQFDIPS